jgi:hypothetical protein
LSGGTASGTDQGRDLSWPIAPPERSIHQSVSERHERFLPGAVAEHETEKQGGEQMPAIIVIGRIPFPDSQGKRMA